MADTGPHTGRIEIHPSAHVDPRARLGAGVRVGPNAVIEAGVEIGDDCEIGIGAIVRRGTVMGRGNRIFQYATVGEAPQDLKYRDEPTRLILGEHNTIREYATLHRGTGETGETRIGSECLIMAYCHVAHDCLVGSKVIMANAASLAGHVEVGDHAILGGFTTVHQFTRIGAHAFTSMSSAINQDVPPCVMVSGNYARAIGINKEGLRRRGFADEVIRALHRSLRLLVKQRPIRPDSWAEVERLSAELPLVAEFAEFVRSSRRGVVR